MKSLTKSILLLVLVALASCQKEEVVSPSEKIVCYTCETSFTYENENKVFVPIGDTIETEYCNKTSLDIARLEAENTRWTNYQGKRAKQLFTCKKR